MANICFFDMKICGEKDNVNEFVKMMKWEDQYKNNGIGRVYEFDVYETMIHENKNGLTTISGNGSCAWSIISAMREVKTNIEDASKNLDLVIEAYSEETGLCFQEHFLIAKGEIIIDECVDYEEYFVEEMDEEDILDLLERENITREELEAATNDNGDYCKGGFALWEFANLEKYHTSIDKKIESSKKMKEEIETTEYLENLLER